MEVFLLSTGVIFLAELGDKAMLATITLATDNSLVGTWVGSTVGMVIADAFAIGVGLWLARQMPEKVVTYGAAEWSVASAIRRTSACCGAR